MSETTTEPTTLRAGDSIAWTRSVPAFPASAGWVLAYRLLWSASMLDIATTASGDDYAVALSAVDSATVPPGRATLVGTVSKSGDRKTIYSAPVTVLADLAAASTFDGRSWAQRALDDARTALLAYTAGGGAHVEAYTIAGRSMKFRSAADLLELIARLERDVVAERHANAIIAGGTPGRILTRNR